jgi:hypothetical protein
MTVAFVGSLRIFLMGILIFKGLTARSLYNSFEVKGLIAYDYNIHKYKIIIVIILLLSYEKTRVL